MGDSDLQGFSRANADRFLRYLQESVISQPSCHASEEKYKKKNELAQTQVHE
jgi:hypothetical protein